MHFVDHSWCSFHNFVLMLVHHPCSDVYLTHLLGCSLACAVQTTRCPAQAGSPVLSGKDSLNLRPPVRLITSTLPTVILLSVILANRGVQACTIICTNKPRVGSPSMM